MSIKKTIITGASIFGLVLLTALSTFYVSLGKCPVGFLSCDNSKKCIPQKLVCNSVRNCQDGSDENETYCGEFHGSRVFQLANEAEGIMIKARKEAEYNISGRSKYIFFCKYDQIPDDCICRIVDFIGCFKKTQIPIFPKEVVMMHLENNSIALRQNETLDTYPELSHLNLSFNNISFIPPRLLHNSRSLRKLFLDHNQIKELPKNMFSETTELVWLKLQNNRLTDFELDIFEPLSKLRSLNLAKNFLTLQNSVFPRLEDLNELFLDSNSIKTLNGLIKNLFNLTVITLRWNNLTVINSSTFCNHSRLLELRLSDNPIHFVESEVFRKLPALNSLYLDDLRLTKDNFRDIATKLNVSLLSIDGISFENLDFKAIADIQRLNYVIFKKFYYCFMTPGLRVDVCLPKTDGISSRENLLENQTLRYAAWLMAFFTCVGNSMVLWGRYKYRDENRSVSLVIRSLAVSDFIMGVYLIIISFYDLKYRNSYHKNADAWMESWGCVLAGVLSVVSSEVSILILTFMSIERFLLISDPFSHHRLNTKNVMMALYIIWLVGVSIAVLPAILYQTSYKFYGIHNGGTCFPLFIQEKYSPGWPYSAFVFLGINLTLLLLIATLYTVLLFSIWQTRRATTLNFLDCEFAIRFFFIVLTDSTCWGPIIVLKILAFMDIDVSGDFAAWLIVFVLPFNSVVNPLLYTFSTPKYRDQIYTTVSNKSFNKKHDSNSNQVTADDSQAKVMPLLSNSSSTNSSMTSSKRNSLLSKKF